MVVQQYEKSVMWSEPPAAAAADGVGCEGGEFAVDLQRVSALAA